MNLAHPPSPVPSLERPNIVLIHCHDLGDWLSCYGHGSVPTPNLQAFADKALVFDNAFATSPLCTPARSSLFTGRSPHANGLMGLSHAGWRYNPDVVTLPETLGSAGYRTALLGLQHEDLDARVLGYEEVHGLGFIPRALEVAKMTENWLAHRPDDRPFFAAIGLWEVHRPWPVEDYDPADPATVEVPPFLPDNEHTRRDISQFHGAIRQMDQAMGQILEAIDSAPNGKETLVIFTTDHGVAFPRAKSTLYDSGVKVALLVRPPASWGVDAGRRQLLASHLDIMPTLAELADAEVPEGVEGKSLLSSLTGPGSDQGHDDRMLFLEKTYHDRYDPIRAVRTHNVKYIRNFLAAPRLPLPLDLEESDTRRGMDDAHLQPRPEEELYLLDEDPWELQNRVEDPEFQELRAELSTALLNHLRDAGDPIIQGPVPPPSAPSRHRESVSQ